jgi:hypothetical protein
MVPETPEPASAPRTPPPGRRRRHAKRGGRTVFTALVLGLALLAWIVARARHEPLPALLAAPPPRVTLTPPQVPEGAHELAGRLLDAEGAAVAEALLALRAGGRPFWTYSSGDGGFVLRGLPEGRFELCALAPPHPPGWFEVEVPAGAGPLELRLAARPPPLEVLPEAPRSSLAGRVVPGGGSRVGGCQVLLVPAPGGDPLAGLVSRRATADEAGHFRVEELVHGDYEVLVLPPFAIASTGPELHRQDIRHGDDGQDLFLTLRCGAIAGTLVDTAGEPLAGAAVLARLEGVPDAVRAAASGADGGFRLEHLPPGSWRLRVRAGEIDVERLVPVEAGRLQTLDLGPLGASGG